MRTILLLRLAAVLVGVGGLACLGGLALAQPRGAPWAVTPRIEATDGEGVYRAVCQGCHLPEGEGARGAAAYPALARNPKLEAAGYPLTVVIRGQRAMPPLGPILDDAQAAAVVGWIRTNLGNDYREPVSPADAAALR